MKQSIESEQAEAGSQGHAAFTQYDFVAYNKLTTSLRHELFLVNQTYNSLTIVVLVLSRVVSLS